MNAIEIRLPALTEMRRIPYLLNLSSLDQRWVWTCPACGWRVGEVEKIDAETAANSHECSAAWSALVFPRTAQ